MTQEYRIVRKKRGVFLTDADGNFLPKHSVESLMNNVIKTQQLPAWVYISYSAEKELYKVGFSGDVDRRMKELGTELKLKIECLYYGEAAAQKLETSLHLLLKRLGCHVEGEWFDLDEGDLWLTRIWGHSRDLAIKHTEKLCDTIDEIIDAVKSKGLREYPRYFAKLLDLDKEDYSIMFLALYYTMTSNYHALKDVPNRNDHRHYLLSMITILSDSGLNYIP